MMEWDHYDDCGKLRAHLCIPTLEARDDFTRLAGTARDVPPKQMNVCDCRERRKRRMSQCLLPRKEVFSQRAAKGVDKYTSFFDGKEKPTFSPLAHAILAVNPLTFASRL